MILDTNVLSELRKVASGRADAVVAAWAQVQDFNHAYLSAVTVMEIEIGILRLERHDAEQAGLLRAWLHDSVLIEFDDRILPFDRAAALRCAALHVPDPASDRDAMIAATALTHRLPLATRNLADFRGMGVVLTNPWDYRVTSSGPA